MGNQAIIDNIDRKILCELHVDARKKIADIAKELGISATAVTKRIEQLKKKGVITGTDIWISPQAIGLPLIAIIVVNTKLSKIEILQALKKRAALKKDFVWTTSHSGIGHYDVLIGIYAKDKEALDEILRLVESLPGVRKASVHIWLDKMPCFQKEKILL
jgi:DNA-binding Lrp family transcriptional regulator